MYRCLSESDTVYHTDTLARHRVCNVLVCVCVTLVGSHACHCILWGQIQIFWLIYDELEKLIHFSPQNRWYRAKHTHKQDTKECECFLRIGSNGHSTLTHSHPIIVCSPVIWLASFFSIWFYCFSLTQFAAQSFYLFIYLFLYCFFFLSFLSFSVCLTVWLSVSVSLVLGCTCKRRAWNNKITWTLLIFFVYISYPFFALCSSNFCFFFFFKSIAAFLSVNKVVETRVQPLVVGVVLAHSLRIRACSLFIRSHFALITSLNPSSLWVASI